MLALLFAPDAVIFTAALLLMLAIGGIAALGLGVDGPDLDLDLDAGPLDWLGLGRLPLIIWLALFLAAFGGLGLLLQQAATAVTGAPLSAWLAAPLTLAVALPATAGAARLLAPVLPRDETTAVELDALVGLSGVVTVGRAAPGSPARTRVLDPHGQAHHVLVEPYEPDVTFGEGDAVLLVRRSGAGFQAVLRDHPLTRTPL